jgi:hypothetical protein
MKSRYRSVAGVSTCTSDRGKHGGSEEVNETYRNGACRQARATELVDWLQRCGRLSRSWPSGVVTSGGTPIGPSPHGPVKTELVRNVGSALDGEDSALVGSTGQRPVLPASRISPVVREGGPRTDCGAARGVGFLSKEQGVRLGQVQTNSLGQRSCRATTRWAFGAHSVFLVL